MYHRRQRAWVAYVRIVTKQQVFTTSSTDRLNSATEVVEPINASRGRLVPAVALMCSTADMAFSFGAGGLTSVLYRKSLQRESLMRSLLGSSNRLRYQIMFSTSKAMCL